MTGAVTLTPDINLWGQLIHQLEQDLGRRCPGDLT